MNIEAASKVYYLNGKDAAAGEVSMPVDVKYLDGGKGVVVTASGVTTGDEFIAVNNEVFSRDLVAQPYRYILVDMDHSRAMEVSTEQLRQIANRHLTVSRQLPNLVIAVYAKDDLPFANARMWEVFVEGTGWDTRVFRMKSEAVAWIKKLVLAKFGVAVTLE